MRVIFTDHIPDYTRRFFIGFIPVITQDIHCVQHPSMNRLQAISNIRERSTDDNAHRVIQIRLLHLVFEINWGYFFSKFWHGIRLYVSIADKSIYRLVVF
ncbi:hypothetical protein BMETH_806_1 [methanotrophic bacterial endosymbiont of Bathymodiolus sp.]|nr:hypothetical protein BMETH_806_1 [methanotrophic bacterial endosymbiont of Bathymodiolus sp.]